MRHNVTKLALNQSGESVWGVFCLGLGNGRLREAKSIHAGYNLEWGLVCAGGRLGGTRGSALGATYPESEQDRNYIFVRVNITDVKFRVFRDAGEWFLTARRNLFVLKGTADRTAKSYCWSTLTIGALN
jgi:hypothetical protein